MSELCERCGGHLDPENYLASFSTGEYLCEGCWTNEEEERERCGWYEDDDTNEARYPEHDDEEL